MTAIAWKYERSESKIVKLKQPKGKLLVVKKSLMIGKIIDLDHEKQQYHLLFDSGEKKWHKRTECIVYSESICGICNASVKSLYKRSSKGWLQTYVAEHGTPICIGSFTPSKGCRLL